MGAAERIERAVAPAVSFSGLELVDVEVLPGRVRVTVDGPEGVDLDAIGTAARHISRALDGCEGAPAGHYELEVSSPGVERRLRRREHFEPLVGSDIAVRTRPGVEGDRRLQGRLTEVDDRGFRICGGTLGDGGRRIEFADLERAHSIFDWRAALAGTSVDGSRSARRHRSGGHAPKPGFEDAQGTETR